MFVVVKLQGFRTIGDRSNLCDGEDPVEWCGEDGVWVEKWLSKDPPLAARAKVYRKDRSRPQVVVCRWDAYCQNVFDRGGNEIPNKIWKRLGPHMLGKCALAGCYRGLFPRQSSGVYISEELGEGDDAESEAAIEAEMTRRYAREEAYWKAEEAKGHYPLGKAPEMQEAHTIETPVPTQPRPAAPPAVPQPLPIPQEEPEEITAQTEEGDWRSFVITRLRLFEGRTVGSLTPNEARGLVPWLEKIGSRWGTVDNNVKAHYNAISQRLEHDKALSLDDEIQAELNYSPPARAR